MSNFTPPFPWFGGKGRITSDVWQRLDPTVTNYIEPFAGSAIMLLQRPGWTPGVNWIETINDADGFVSNFWRAVQHDPEAVAHYADWPTLENDLHARHAWLVRNHLGTLAPRLEGDPDYYDAKIAGWWVWGLCCWIGRGWCSGKGPWQQVDGMFVNGNTEQGVWRTRVHLGSAGQGVNRQLVHLGDARQGVNRHLVHLGNTGKGEAGTGEQGLMSWMLALAERLRRVRVTCGDWRRICGQTPTTKLGTTAVFLDPPYSAEAGRDNDLYAVESRTVAYDVREWAIAHGDDPMFRIALCGYDTEHVMPDNWTRHAWRASGGYANQGDGTNDNGNRETVWFSPHCLESQVTAPTLFDLLDRGLR